MFSCKKNKIFFLPGIVRSLVYKPDGEHFITVGDDKTIKTWNSSSPGFGEEEEPINTILSRTILTGITHHRKDPIIATCGEICQLWEHNRNEPIRSMKWGVDSIHDATFNQVETMLLAACASDRSIILYDTREAKPLRKVVMTLKSNKLAWNPMEAFIFTIANEDYK